jgi:hypothetical protein
MVKGGPRGRHNGEARIMAKVIAIMSMSLDVYRHQLKPVITKGTETMNTIFNQHNQAKSA